MRGYFFLQEFKNNLQYFRPYQLVSEASAACGAEKHEQLRLALQGKEGYQFWFSLNHHTFSSTLEQQILRNPKVSAAWKLRLNHLVKKASTNLFFLLSLRKTPDIPLRMNSHGCLHRGCYKRKRSRTALAACQKYGCPHSTPHHFFQSLIIFFRK